MCLQSYKDKSLHLILWNCSRTKRGNYHLNYCVIFGSRSRKLEKVTIRFVMSVRLSAWNNSAPTGPTFIKFYISGFFEKLSKLFSFIRIGKE